MNTACYSSLKTGQPDLLVTLQQRVPQLTVATQLSAPPVIPVRGKLARVLPGLPCGQVVHINDCCYWLMQLLNDVVGRIAIVGLEELNLLGLRDLERVVKIATPLSAAQLAVLAEHVEVIVIGENQPLGKRLHTKPACVLQIAATPAAGRYRMQAHITQVAGAAFVEQLDCQIEIDWAGKKTPA